MKRMTFLCLIFLLCSGLTAQVIIGSGTQMQFSPLSTNYVYKRALAMYLASEINQAGRIDKLALNAGVINSRLSTPFKIYLKHSPAASLNAEIWDQAIVGASLVYSGNVIVSELGWHDFDVSDFEYNGVDNLLCFFESGPAILGNPNPQWYYSNSSPLCLYARRTSNSSFLSYLSNSFQRPNIRLTFEETSPRLQITKDALGSPTLAWDAIPGCTQYQVLCSPDPHSPQPWQILDTVATPFYTPGTVFSRMFFRIRGIHAR